MKSYIIKLYKTPLQGFNFLTIYDVKGNLLKPVASLKIDNVDYKELKKLIK